MHFNSEWYQYKYLLQAWDLQQILENLQEISQAIYIRSKNFIRLIKKLTYMATIRQSK